MVAPPMLSTTEENQNLVTLWHKECPTLEAVILPKITIWAESNGSWLCLDPDAEASPICDHLIDQLKS
jgi:hypothetical protein